VSTNSSFGLGTTLFISADFLTGCQHCRCGDAESPSPTLLHNNVRDVQPDRFTVNLLERVNVSTSGWRAEFDGKDWIIDVQAGDPSRVRVMGCIEFEGASELWAESVRFPAARTGSPSLTRWGMGGKRYFVAMVKQDDGQWVAISAEPGNSNREVIDSGASVKFSWVTPPCSIQLSAP